MMVISCCRTKLIYCFISDPIKKENEDSGACSDKGNNDFMNGQRKMVGEEKESNSDIRKKTESHGIEQRMEKRKEEQMSKQHSSTVYTGRKMKK